MHNLNTWGWKMVLGVKDEFIAKLGEVFEVQSMMVVKTCDLRTYYICCTEQSKVSWWIIFGRVGHEIDKILSNGWLLRIDCLHGACCSI